MTREGIVTLDERIKSLLSLSNGKALGSDGLSANPYKMFRNLIANLVLNDLKFAYLYHHRRTVTRYHYTHPKPDKDNTLLKNYRLPPTNPP